MNIRRVCSVIVGAAALFMLLLPNTPLMASTSSHYQIQEDFVGGTGGINGTSSHYSIGDSGGAAAAGPMSGTAFKEQAGPQSTNDPNLSFSVANISVGLGALSPSATQSGTSTFSVLNYTSYGYQVLLIGNTPSNGSHNLTAMSGASSTTGTEQFGINLAANTSPSVGSAPSQQPDATFGFGSAASGYNTANSFKFHAGDTIAQATKSSGVTNYTISYVANISTTTPGGSYQSNLTLVCVGTY